ncbi:hypothetical protein [Armatimonas sp.]|uniref:hypothetical protein n=1 Tax=Armatimonas sp. TaxID=1872638 RepID=UPI0037508615
MKGLLGAFLGAVALGIATASYQQSLPPDQAGEILWGLIFLQAVPSGAALGMGAELAMRAPAGRHRALCCFAGGLLGLVPPGIWAWLAVSGDPFHALPKLWATLVLCMPTLGAILVMNLWGLASLRPVRFPTKEKESDES